MKIREITEAPITEDMADYKTKTGQSSAIPGNGSSSVTDTRRKQKKNKVEALVRDK